MYSHVYMYMCVHECVSEYCIYMETYMVCMHVYGMYAWVHVYVYAHMHVYIYICGWIYACIHVYIHIYVL